MRIEFSRLKQWDFYYLMKGWIEKQEERLWVCAPFIDDLGFSLLNYGSVKDWRIITRRDDNPKEDLESWERKGLLQINEDIHTKLYIGDSTCWLGSANLTYYSLVDNYEVLVELTPIPRQLAEYFRKLWEHWEDKK
jgi:phosphatidylserine/phosphatidylglycerophosphate/cardiolipin synthase-like enzyme